MKFAALFFLPAAAAFCANFLATFGSAWITASALDAAGNIYRWDHYISKYSSHPRRLSTDFPASDLRIYRIPWATANPLRSRICREDRSCRREDYLGNLPRRRIVGHPRCHLRWCYGCTTALAWVVRDASEKYVADKAVKLRSG
jgi:hypothetical protein